MTDQLEDSQIGAIETLQRKLRVYQIVTGVYTFLLLAAGGFFLAPRMIHPVYEVRVDGKVVGAVAETASVDRVLAEIKKQKGEGLDKESDFTQKVEVLPTYFDRKKAIGAEELKTILADKLTLKTPAVVIMANGMPAGAVPREEDANAALDMLKKKYSEGRKLEGEPSFKEKVTLEKVEIDPASVFQTRDEALEALLTGGDESTHTVGNGENAWSIAKKYGLSPEDLTKLNPGRDLDRLAIGDELQVGKSKAAVTVITTERRTITREIPFKGRIEKAPWVYAGKQYVTQHGRPGKERIEALVTCENGAEVQRRNGGAVVLLRPREEVTVVGTKARPAEASHSRRSRRSRGR